MAEDEDDEKDMAKKIQDEIQDGGAQATDKTFALMPGKDAVLFVIKNLPGQEGKSLGMQLPPEMAVQLGNALVACAVVVAKLGDTEEEEDDEDEVIIEKKVTLH